jgi:hypothetical protein
MISLSTVRAFAAAALVLAATADRLPAADRLFWGDSSLDIMSFANADGSGEGGDVVAPGATMACTWGTAIDPAAGRIYWTGCGARGISFANLDGSGGGTLDVTGATVDDPSGLTIHPVTRVLYWANRGGTTIGTFGLRDGVGADLVTTGATVAAPSGVALDVAGGRVLWGNGNPSHTIAWAKLDGSGGGVLDTTGAPVDDPSGVAIDAAAGRVYWTNYAGNSIGYASLGGGGGGELVAPGATVSGPVGAAIDAAAGVIYWANYNGGRLSSARLDGTGGGDLETTGATVPAEPSYPALLTRPVAVGAPVVAGGGEPDAVLTCAGVNWASDDVGAFCYRAPQTVRYRWTRDGTDVPGATASTYAAFAPGEYRCVVTAENFAGETSRTSAPHVVAAPPTPDAPTACAVPSVVGLGQDAVGGAARAERLHRRQGEAPARVAGAGRPGRRPAPEGGQDARPGGEGEARRRAGPGAIAPRRPMRAAHSGFAITWIDSVGWLSMRMTVPPKCSVSRPGARFASSVTCDTGATSSVTRVVPDASTSSLMKRCCTDSSETRSRLPSFASTRKRASCPTPSTPEPPRVFAMRETVSSMGPV